MTVLTMTVGYIPVMIDDLDSRLYLEAEVVDLTSDFPLSAILASEDLQYLMNIGHVQIRDQDLILILNLNEYSESLDQDLQDIANLAAVEGDILYKDATQWNRLPIGTAGDVLKVNPGETAPEWAPESGGTGNQGYHQIFMLMGA